MNVGYKIRRVREIKNYSQDFIAEKLNISPRAYSKIESEETKLSVDRLNQIAEILEVKPEDLLNFDEKIVIYNLTNGDGVVYNKNVSENERNTYEKLVAHLQEEIIFLRGQLTK